MERGKVSGDVSLTSQGDREAVMKKRVCTLLLVSGLLFAAGCNSGTDIPENTETSVSEAASV